MSKGKNDVRPWSSYGVLGVVGVVLALLASRRPQRGRRAGEATLDAPAATSTTWLRRFVTNLAAHDWMLAIYLLFLLGAVLHGSGPRRAAAVSWLLGDLAGLALALLLVRGEVLQPGFRRSLLYRLSLLGALLGSFLQLQYVLPTATHYALDAQIYALDKGLFGFEPAEAWDRFVTPATTEWFSFFYYGYFFILAIHVLPFMFLARDMRIFSEFAFGILFLFCVGHVLYLVVPGYGPYLFLAHRFAHPLDGQFWWRLVRETVNSVDGAARKDIFPSLHTAAPTFLALFSFRHRRAVPFRFTWPLLFFFASQIIIATMFLRWHYLIDICAGITLASSALLTAREVAAWERNRRAALDLPPVWTELSWTRRASIDHAPALTSASEQGREKTQRFG